MPGTSTPQLPFWLSSIAAWLALALLLGFSVPVMNNGQYLLATLFIVMIAWCQYLLVQLMHEAVHHFFARKSASSLLAAWLTAYPMGMNRIYRDLHINHHKFFTDPEKDCDYAGYANFPESKLAMLKWFFWNLSGLAAISQFFGQNQLATQQNRLLELAMTALAQLLLLLFFTVYGQWWMYLVFWLLPLLTLVKSLSTMRLLAEHGDPNHTAVLRDFHASWLMRNLIGPIGFADHARHHQSMAVPFNQLNTVKIDETTLPVPYENYHGHHLKLLWQWFWQLPLTGASND